MTNLTHIVSSDMTAPRGRPHPMFRFNIMNALCTQVLLSLALFQGALSHANDEFSGIPYTGEMLQSFLTEDMCLTNAQGYLGCIHAINQLLLGAVPARQIYPKLRRESSKTPANSIQNFHWFEVRPIIPGRNTRENRLAFENSILNHYLNVMEEKSFEPRNKSSDVIQPVLQYALGEVSKSEYQKLLIGLSINRFYETAVDPHTGFLPKVTFTNMENILQAKEFDLGVQLGVGRKKMSVVIAGFLDDSASALAAGLRIGDQLIALSDDGVNFTSIEGYSPDAISVALTGDENTLLHVRVMRGEQVLTFQVKRQKSLDNSVLGKIVEHSGMKLGWIRLKNFVQNQLCEDFAAELTRLKREGARGFILDLRDNGGGKLPYAFCISEAFLEKDAKVVEVRYFQRGKRPQERLAQSEPLSRLPLAVLINARSASASEIVAGALRDNKRAWLVGVRSFGKGTVQQLMPARDLFERGHFPRNWEPIVDQLYYRETIARFYQPLGSTNQIHGISPSFEVFRNPNPSVEEMSFKREEDRYTNALSSVGKPWTETRTQEIVGIKQCAEEPAKKTFQKHQQDPYPVDYQLYYAEEVLRCSR